MSKMRVFFRILSHESPHESVDYAFILDSYANPLRTQLVLAGTWMDEEPPYLDLGEFQLPKCPKGTKMDAELFKKQIRPSWEEVLQLVLPKLIKRGNQNG